MPPLQEPLDDDHHEYRRRDDERKAGKAAAGVCSPGRVAASTSNWSVRSSASVNVMNTLTVHSGRRATLPGHPSTRGWRSAAAPISSTPLRVTRRDESAR